MTDRVARDASVLVVGAGPTGLLVAAELHRRAISCLLIDDRPEPQHWDRATVVHPRSLEVFEMLGFVEPLLDAGVPQRLARIHAHGEVLGEVDLSTSGSAYGYNLGLSEEVTEGFLTEYLHAQGGEVRRSCRLVGMEDRGDHVIAALEHDGTVEQSAFRWIVGCDGIHGASRRLSGIEVEGHDLRPWAVFDATTPGWRGTYEGNFVFLDDVSVILTALPGPSWRVYLRPTSDDADLVAEASATLHRYFPDVSFADVANPRAFRCHSQVARRFRSGRVLVVGDAAHVCSPSQGHGMNAGIQDAFNLAWKLALVCQGHCGDELLDSYEAERRPVAQMILRSGDDFENAQAVHDPDEERARDEALQAQLSDPSRCHHEAVAEAELDVDYADSPIVMGDPHRALGPGGRVPTDLKRGPVTAGALHPVGGGHRHTVLLADAGTTEPGDVVELAGTLTRAIDAALSDGVVVASQRPPDGPLGDGTAWMQLEPADLDRLGTGGLTLFAVRPDGHVGLRADHDHLEALRAYQERLVAGAPA